MEFNQRPLKYILLFAFVVLIGTVFIRLVESFNWVDSFYMIMMTCTTVGYGDVTAQTKLGKAFISFYSVVSIYALLQVFTCFNI